MAMYVNNLGNILSTSYSRTGDMDYLDQVVANSQQAAGLTAVNNHGRPMYPNNLGIWLRDRYAEKDKCLAWAE